MSLARCSACPFSDLGRPRNGDTVPLPLKAITFAGLATTIGAGIARVPEREVLQHQCPATKPILISNGIVPDAL